MVRPSSPARIDQRFPYGPGNANIGHFNEVVSTTTSRLESLISEINRKVYDLYSALPSDDDLARTWTPLLEGCSALGVRTEVVTTNYDMIIESALDKSSVADNGWRGAVYRTLDTDLWGFGQEPSRKGLLTKLHGSVNWSRQGDTVFVSDPTYKGAHDRHAIIYPGFKGRPIDPMFLSFHEHLRRSLRAARVVIFIGFAFRDPYINEICQAAIGTGTTTIVVNPQRVVLPFAEDTTTYIEAPFDTDSAAKILQHARTALSAA